jgi:glutathione-regulated potassium-efflux system ancillary protein KefF
VITVFFAHPHPRRSIANKALLAAIADLSGVSIHPLYERYPDFAIDVSAERELLARSRVVVWQAPLYWYTVPALLKLWFEQVLSEGWAFGEGGTALAGKDALWVTTTGAAAAEFAPEGRHRFTFAQFEPVVRQTAQFCGMNWQEPLVVHAAHRLDAAALAAAAGGYRERLTQLLRRHDG